MFPPTSNRTEMDGIYRFHYNRNRTKETASFLTQETWSQNEKYSTSNKITPFSPRPFPVVSCTVTVCKYYDTNTTIPLTVSFL